MKEIAELIIHKINENWGKVLVAGLFTLLGWLIAYRKAMRNWNRREFFDRVNVSLNTIRDNRLLLRTLMEKRCEELFHNQAAVRTILQAAQKTTADDPILKLPTNEYWYYLNPLLNDLSEQFAEGTLKKELGAPVSCAEYVICLTCESAGSLRQKKIRAMVIRKSLILTLPEEAPQFDHPNHATRWATLKQLATYYCSTPERFITMEICA